MFGTILQMDKWEYAGVAWTDHGVRQGLKPYWYIQHYDSQNEDSMESLDEGGKSFHSMTFALERMGELGWELVLETTTLDDRPTFLFKRKVS